MISAVYKRSLLALHYGDCRIFLHGFRLFLFFLECDSPTSSLSSFSNWLSAFKKSLRIPLTSSSTGFCLKGETKVYTNGTFPPSLVRRKIILNENCMGFLFIFYVVEFQSLFSASSSSEIRLKTLSIF